MPTGSEFEAAAEKFMTAAQLVGELIGAASGAGAAHILVGGSLGRQVPEQIAVAQQTATVCQEAIMDAVQICLERAAIISEYEIRLDIYLTAYGYFERASRHWAAQFNAWLLDETGYVIRPNDPPRPPTRPVPPADWAEVRRL